MQSIAKASQDRSIAEFEKVRKLQFIQKLGPGIILTVIKFDFKLSHSFSQQTIESHNQYVIEDPIVKVWLVIPALLVVVVN